MSEHWLAVRVPIPQADLAPRAAVGPDAAGFGRGELLERAERLRTRVVAGHEAPAAGELTRRIPM